MVVDDHRKKLNILGGGEYMEVMDVVHSTHSRKEGLK